MNILPADIDLKFPHILQVEASAGSGKTYLLSQRFVQYLLSRDIPHSHCANILAITFTNAASKEMKRRILEMLKKAVFGSPETLNGLSRLVSIPKKDIQKAALKNVEYIVSHYDDLNIRTIDSFVNLLVQAAHFELGISPQSQVEKDEAPFMDMALDRLFLYSQKDQYLWKLFLKFIFHYLHFEGKGAWWPREGLLDQLSFLMDREKIHGLDFTVRTKINTPMLAKRLCLKTEQLLHEIDNADITLKKNHRKALEEVVAGRDLLKHLKKAAWKQDSLSKLLLKGESYPPDLNHEWKVILRLAQAFVLAFAKEKNVPYIQLLSPWKDELEFLKKRARIFFISDINKFAQKMHNESLLPEVFFRWGEKIYHIFIDEFQDTSVLQWENLFPLLQNALAAGGTLFFVGDRKQLLYRWRGSSLMVSEKGSESLRNIAGPNLASLRLPYNWRSRKVLIDFVARCFQETNLNNLLDEMKIESGAPILKIFSHVKQDIPESLIEERKGGFVRIEVLPDRQFIDEARKEAWLKTARLLKDNLLKRYTADEISILVRKNSELEEITQVLSHKGIPIVSQRQQDIRNNQLIKEFIAFLTFLESPDDDTAFATVIAGKLLKRFWQEHSPGEHAWTWLEKNNDPDKGLYQSFKIDFPAFWDQVFYRPFKLIGCIPAYELSSMLFKRLDIMNDHPEHWPLFCLFLEALHQRQPWTGGDISSFLDWLPEAPMEHFIPQGLQQTADAVRVLTIHMAKGLENKVVVIPFACLNSKDQNIILQKKERNLSLCYITKELSDISPRLMGSYHDEKALSFIDELNVLYVALTRAKDELYVFTPKKLGKRKNPFLTLLNTVIDDKNSLSVGKPVDYEREIKKDLPGLFPNAPKKAPYILTDKPGKTPQPVLTFSRRKAMGIGSAVHDMLSSLTEPLLCSPSPPALFKFLDDILTDELREKIKPDILLKIANTLGLPEAKSIFWPDPSAHIYTEKEISDENGNLNRVDRLVISGKKAILAEFKMGAPQLEDHRQVKRYLRLLKSIYNVHSFSSFIMYFEDERVEEVGM